ncbi:MAG: B12-binding domain-containing radical SAM protein [Lachnospiraceae bacterium]|nr:B12-binding domain-containing radical SAM protein [Lachnospiraceae bacterium]
MKNNYLIIMPRTVTIVGEGYFFPLGIAYVSSAMKAAGLNVFSLNLNHIDGNIDDIIKKEILINKIDVVMTGGLSSQFNSLKRIIDCVKQNFSNIKVVLGGGIISADPQTAMSAFENADFGVIGEGEITSVELCKALDSNVGVTNISGIIYYANGWVETKPVDDISDLDALPFPDYDGFGLNHFLELPLMSNLNSAATRSFYMVGSRSCPYQCTFCFHTAGKRYRQRSIGSIKAEMELLVHKYGVNHIFFSDELFARKKDRVTAIVEIAKELDITWGSNFRIDDINEELINIIKDGNCTIMGLGLESADNQILRSMKKNITIEQIDKALYMIHNSGIPYTGNFIFGDVEETIETVERTLEYWEKHTEYAIWLTFIIVYPGTKLYQYALSNGIINDAVQFLKDGCPQVNVSKISDEDLPKLTEKILEMEADKLPKVKDIELLSWDVSGRMKIRGTCVKCNHGNIWENLKLLVASNWLYCTSCSQKHMVPFPEELKDSFIRKFLNIKNMKDKIGLWGISYYTIGLFRENEIFKGDNIFFIDNASAKQNIMIHDKKVSSPDILITENIGTVIFFYTSSIIATVADEIQEKYPHVTKFYKIFDLL